MVKKDFIHGFDVLHVASECGHFLFLYKVIGHGYVTSASSLTTAFKQHLKLHLFCFSFPGLFPL